MKLDIREYHENNKDTFKKLQSEVEKLFRESLDLYAVKGRIKTVDSLEHKLRRKELVPTTEKELLDNIYDIVGVRLVYLIGMDFILVHDYINHLDATGVLTLCAKPKAYTHSEEAGFYSGLGIDIKTKESKYTSVHYTIKLRGYGDLCCEIQVRSLFEEAWCEIDHLVNYPEKNGNRLCRESLKELADLVKESNTLADKIIIEAHSKASGTP